MPKADRVPNDDLLAAGLELMRRAGMALERQPSKGRAMIYRKYDGETVRVRTCNDHLLVVLADRDDEHAKLNIEGTDHVLIVMPQVPRQHGPVVAYLVPTEVVAEAARSTHREWLATNPNTRGDNRTWNLWFDEGGPSKANGFAKKWERYRLKGSAETRPQAISTESVRSGGAPKLAEVISAAKRQIADVAGVPIDAVRISVELP